MEMVIATQNTMISLNGMTVKCTQKIAERTEDVMMGAIKAQMIETLKTKMANGVAHFIVFLNLALIINKLNNKEQKRHSKTYQLV